MDCTEVHKIAKKYGFNEINVNNKFCISYVKLMNNKAKIRINIYWTTGTVAICWPKKQQKFTKQNKLHDLEIIFSNNGYYNEGCL